MPSAEDFFWVICINMNEDSGNQWPVLLNGRTVLRVHEMRTSRAECEVFPIKFLDRYSLLMLSQALFLIHMRGPPIWEPAPKILYLEAAEPAPAPIAKAKNLCISRHQIRTNPGFSRVACQWLGVHSSSAKNPSALCFHEPLPLHQ